MTEDKPIPKENETPILSFIQEIKDGMLDPRTLDKNMRQQCVEVFLLEGLAVVSIAQILNRNEKTIRRDIAVIRQRNAVSPDPLLANKLIGEFLVYFRVHRDFLMRLARSKDTSLDAKARAEYYAAQIESNTITKLQSLGYLPCQPQADKLLVDQSKHYHFSSVVQQIRRILDEERRLPEPEGNIEGDTQALP